MEEARDQEKENIKKRGTNHLTKEKGGKRWRREGHVRLKFSNNMVMDDFEDNKKAANLDEVWVRFQKKH